MLSHQIFNRFKAQSFGNFVRIERGDFVMNIVQFVHHENVEVNVLVWLFTNVLKHLNLSSVNQNSCNFSTFSFDWGVVSVFPDREHLFGDRHKFFSAENPWDSGLSKIVFKHENCFNECEDWWEQMLVIWLDPVSQQFSDHNVASLELFSLCGIGLRVENVFLEVPQHMFCQNSDWVKNKEFVSSVCLVLMETHRVNEVVELRQFIRNKADGHKMNKVFSQNWVVCLWKSSKCSGD